MALYMHFFRFVLGASLLACLAAWTACAPVAAPITKARSMGERVTVGSLVYNVFETQWKSQLGEGTDARVPKDRFFLVRLSIGNSSPADLMVPTATLVDDAGQMYTELGDGEGVSSWIGFLRHVKPAETLVGNIVFDAPPKHYRLRISDENSQKTEEIDLPLNFTPDTTEIPQPAQ
jgi:hypothetical protein